MSDFRRVRTRLVLAAAAVLAPHGAYAGLVTAAAAVYTDDVGSFNVFPPSAPVFASATADPYLARVAPSPSMATSAYAYADLASGTVGSDSYTRPFAPGDPGAFLGDFAASTATMREGLHFTGSILAPTTVTFLIDVDGFLTDSFDGFADLQFSFELYTDGYSPATFSGHWVSDGTAECAGVTIAAGSCFLGAGEVDETVILSTVIDDASRDVYFNLWFGTRARYGASADFSQTARLGLSFQEGLSFTSDSGVFLSQGNEPVDVPEPSSLSLALLGGLLAFGAMVARRTRSRAMWVSPRGRRR